MHRVQHTEHVARVSGAAMAALFLRLCAVLALGVVTLLVFPDRAAYAATPTAAQKTVLILNSERREFPAVIAFEAGLREGIDNADGNITLHFEYLDLGRFPSEQAVLEMGARFARRYAGIKFDAVVLYAESAAEFAISQRNKLFPGVPVIAAAVERDWLQKHVLPEGFVAVPVTYDYKRTIKLAQALQPGLREVVIVHGVAEFDTRRRDEAVETIQRIEPAMSYRTLGGIPLSEIESQVRQVSATSMILLTSMVRDAEGRAFLGQNVAERLASISRAPLYSTFESHFNRGSIGGAITDNTEFGRVAAKTAQTVLNGAGDGRRIAELGPAPLWVNWNALKRWQLDESRVPPDAQIKFRPRGLWEQHGRMIAGGVLAIILQAALITLLFLELIAKRRAERTLRESEERFRRMADTAPVMIWMCGAHKECTFVNHGWIEFTGRSLEQHLGDGWAESLHPEDRQRVLGIYNEACDSRRKFACEYRCRRYDGEYRWLTDEGAPRLGPDGSFLGYVGTCVDISERRESENMLRQVVEALPTAIVMMDAEGIIRLANDETTRLFGYARDELMGRRAEMLSPLALRREYATLTQKFLAASRRQVTEPGQEVRLQRKDGSEFVAEVALNPVHTHEGPVVLISIIDVTQRKRGEELVKHERAFLRQVIDINPNFIFAKDREGRFTLVNKAVADAYGTTVENLVGKSDADFNTNHEQIDQFQRADLEVIKSERERFIAEEQITDAAGNVRWLQTVKRPIFDDNGRAVQVLGASTDITLRKAAESEVHQQRVELAHVTRVSAMGELASSIAHELNQPLTAIMSNAQAARRFLAMPEADMTEIRETIDDVVQECTRASEVIRRLRALVRKGELEVTELNVENVITDVVALVHSDAIVRGIRVELEIQPNLGPCQGDRVQLQQVVLNLLLNAFDAMKERPRRDRIATVQVTLQNNRMRVSVRDRGTGLTSDKLDRIFTPFFTTKREGLGLGLSICRSIIEAHGGRLRAENNRDQGATFYFTLPCDAMASSSQQGIRA